MSQEENAGRVSIPLQRELEAWQELAKDFANRLARKDWHRLNAMETLLVRQLEEFGYLEKASCGFVGKRISI
jgi:hypothetical protein